VKVSFAVIPGAGSAGLTWRPVAGRIGARVLPMPPGESVFEIAASLQPEVAALPRPRVLVGTSAGGMAAIEIARRTTVDALVFVAAGFGITVGEAALQWLIDYQPDLHAKLARVCLHDRSDLERQRLIVEDYEACGQPDHVAHLTAVAAYRPEPLLDPPPTLVLWGAHDRAIPLEDQVELAKRMAGVLVPIADAAHVPFLEQPDVVTGWLELAGRLGARASAENSLL